jgi:uncharacterized protein (TIGR02147 family)
VSLRPSVQSVFTYVDYRTFLREAYNERKTRGLSHRWLARRAGLSSPSFLKAVMDRKKNLAPATATRVALALGLVGDAAEYFCTLVRLNQTTVPADRRSLQAELGRLRRYQEVQSLEMARDAYHKNWYHLAIRELSASSSFRPDPKWIARVLRPRISVSQARRALATLEQLGLLQRDGAGALRPAHGQVTTELEPASDQIATFHRAMMARASQAIDDVPRPERDISSITLCTDASGLSGLKRRLQEIRRELLDEFDAGKAGVQVLQVNLQMFPLSERFDQERR